MLKKFFILCSGADHVLLDSCAPGEQNKYAGIGATVFFTAVMAFLASAYALYTVFDNYFAAIGFGLVWGLLIFNLDRYIVSTIKKTGRFSNELFQAAPRLILAINSPTNGAQAMVQPKINKVQLPIQSLRV